MTLTKYDFINKFDIKKHNQNENIYEFVIVVVVLMSSPRKLVSSKRTLFAREDKFDIECVCVCVCYVEYLRQTVSFLEQ